MGNEVKERYSFSKLSSFNTCKYGFKKRYIDGLKGEGNAFSSYGTLVHSLLERYARNEVELWDLVKMYEWEFESAVPESFPLNKFCDLKSTYYKQGIEFLKSFQGYEAEKIKGVEEEFCLPIDDWELNGFIDIILDEDGKLVLQDYKSKASFKSKAEQAKYARQLYLYSLFVKQKYGKFPDILRFLMFRKQKIVDIEFNEDDLNEAIEWARNTVKEIRECWDYSASPDDFFCENLCNQRNACEFKNVGR